MKNSFLLLAVCPLLALGQTTVTSHSLVNLTPTTIELGHASDTTLAVYSPPLN